MIARRNRGGGSGVDRSDYVIPERDSGPTSRTGGPIPSPCNFESLRGRTQMRGFVLLYKTQGGGPEPHPDVNHSDQSVVGAGSAILSSPSRCFCRSTSASYESRRPRHR